MQLDTTKYIGKRQVCEICGNVSPVTIRRWEIGRGFPRRIYLSPQKVVWPLEDVLAWVERRASGVFGPEQRDRTVARDRSQDVGGAE